MHDGGGLMAIENLAQPSWSTISPSSSGPHFTAQRLPRDRLS